MNEQMLFAHWIKAKAATERAYNCAVICSRVSSKEQAMINLSLQFHKQAIVEYAQKYDFNIVGEFGGTYESANMDGRREFIGCSSSLKPTIVWLSTPSKAGWLKKIAEKNIRFLLSLKRDLYLPAGLTIKMTHLLQ